VRGARRDRVGASAILIAVVCLAFPSLASAKLNTFGALGRTAQVAYAHGGDAAFWSGASGAIPVKGQVRAIRIRGCAEPLAPGQTPATQVHFQVAVPESGGAIQVQETSAPVNVPTCGIAGASPRTVTSFALQFLCVSPGDFVVFNDEGGNVPFELFAHASGASTDFFSASGETNNGDTLTPTALSGVRLLMQVVVGTGKNAPDCKT
jgi:hypothetical protein